MIKEVEDVEVEHPSPRKIAQQAVVFETRSSWPGPFSRLMGPKSDPILCDLGEARTGQELYEGIIQPAAYRAPEVFLHIPWNNQVDIWNLGCFVSRLPVYLKDATHYSENTDVGHNVWSTHLFTNRRTRRIIC